MEAESETLSPAAFRPRPSEWLVLLGILVVMFVVNIRTYNLYPTVWADEVLWSEPAINLIKTGHFHTWVWQLQPGGTFWAAQSPLYCFALAGWLPLAGTSLLAVRSFNYFLISVAVVLVWYATGRLRLIDRPRNRLLLAPLLLLGYGISFSFRCSRPDILGMICLTLFGLAFSVASPSRRLIALFLTAALAPWVGIQIGLYVFLASLAAKLFFREVRLKDVLAIWLGIGLGAASVLLLYHLKGVLPNFMGTIFQAANEHAHWGQKPSYFATVPRRLRGAFTGHFGDFSTLPLLLGLALLAIGFRRQISAPRRRVLGFIICMYFGIPLAFSFTGHFGFYYSYMLYVPLTVAVLCVFDSLPRATESRPRNYARIVLGGAVVGAMLLGLPLRLGLALKFLHIVPRETYAQTIQSALRPDDVVFAHYTAFFEAKQVAHTVYSPMYAKSLVDLTPAAHDFTPAEKARLTVLIVWTNQLRNFQDYFGGEWTPVTPPLGDSFAATEFADVPLVGRKLENHFGAPQLQRYPLQVYRRKTALAVATTGGPHNPK